MTLDELTPRQRQIVELLALGYSNPEIASELDWHISTVKRWIQEMCVRAGVENRMRLVLHFYEVHPRLSRGAPGEPKFPIRKALNTF